MAQRNVTMVAFHGGTKPSSLERLLADVFQDLRAAVGSSNPDVFDRLDLKQIHATLIGMEVDIVGMQFFGYWFRQNRSGTQRAIDIQHFVDLLKRLAKRDPIFTIRFGGFREAHCTCVGRSLEGWACPTSNAEFHSCDRSAYEGSFYAYAPGPAILTGWPVQTADPPNVFTHGLYDFRLAAESAGFLDKYHRDKAPRWMDDDCYIKLGSFKEPVANLNRVEEAVRQCLHKRDPITVDVKAEDISIVLYEDPSLKDIIDRVSLADAIADQRRIIQLYHRLLNGRCK